MSTNEGLNWSVVNSGITDTVIESLGLDGNNILAGTFNGNIFLSSDNGQSWTLKKNGITAHFITSIISLGNSLFIGTDAGVYQSTNHGDSWNLISDGINSTIQSLTVSPEYLFAGSDNGVWKRSLAELTSVSNKDNNLPQLFTLAQNYPNPFNPTTNIKYSLAQAGNVKLIVYNILGSKVATLVNDYKPAGSYSVQFNGTNLASGIYLYRLESGAYTSTKKLILLK